MARVGGEEFAVILPEAGKPGGLALAEKLRRLVEAEPFAYNGVSIPVTISLGVAGYEAQFENSETMVSEADEKLYEAKRGGRNRVCS